MTRGTPCRKLRSRQRATGRASPWRPAGFVTRGATAYGIGRDRLLAARAPAFDTRRLAFLPSERLRALTAIPPEADTAACRGE